MRGRVGEGASGRREGHPALFRSLPWSAALTIFLGLSFSLAASVGGGEVFLSSGGRALVPGETVIIRWAGLPEDAEEFELLLRSESPVRQKLRLTEQLDPELRRFVWRVPDLPCTSARIVLRCGIEGKGEVTWGRSAPFRIADADGGSRQSVRFEEGEWWISYSPPSRNAASLAGATGQQLNGLPLPFSGAEPGPDSQIPHDQGAWVGQRAPLPAAMWPRALNREDSTGPLKVPLRI